MKENIGYGRPPESGQFQSGVSGNPRGRPKGAFGIARRLRAALSVRAADGTDPADRMVASLVADAERDPKRAMAMIALLLKYDEKAVENSDD